MDGDGDLSTDGRDMGERGGGVRAAMVASSEPGESGSRRKGICVRSSAGKGGEVGALISPESKRVGILERLSRPKPGDDVFSSPRRCPERPPNGVRGMLM